MSKRILGKIVFVKNQDKERARGNRRTSKGDDWGFIRENCPKCGTPPLRGRSFKFHCCPDPECDTLLADYYFKLSSLPGARAPMTVSFEVVERDKGPEAVNIQVFYEEEKR